MKRIEVISLDRIGLVSEITKVIRRTNGNILNHTANVVTDSSGIAFSHFTADVELSDTDVTAVLRRLRKIKNVRQVKTADL